MRKLWIALTFLTRIPLPQPANVTSEEFTLSQHYYPLVGLILGGVLWASLALLLPIYPPLITAALVLILELILTGGIHLDGFMDSMDGLLSARTPDRMLEIMKDSHVGAFGAVSTMVFLLLKFTLLAELFSLGSLAALYLVLFMPIIARWIFLIGVYYFPYAREKGLGKGFHEASQNTKWIFISQGLLLLLLTYTILNWSGLVGFSLATLGIFFFTRKVARLLGGLTGDLYGASIELAELFFLLGAFPFIF
ncbi:cobalamin-5'-phosphate synthase [Desulfitobacterium dichloroeliminans LMG P-21439]|uniref:Adenosylcobinamide-GDP ribazoletransferase n=1 Tax=Desulfitobacterium dichloroeliminans (strain LMG P-21439 / DCA1) TaxID=871963 RepID=L0F934_DESDL|nr:adenosylcobinamide-GDP ribazoletransferase [Desulfitobacterium dichloroeliminans]AGA69717.1 cobalamin-5'-phosphate synthase [Desulfitobacterium dichloroeliminans LMG P-21439]